MFTCCKNLYHTCLHVHAVNILYHSCTYSRPPEDEPSCSKQVEKIKIKILVQQRCILLVCTVPGWVLISS